MRSSPYAYFIFTCFLYHIARKVLEQCLKIGKTLKNFVLKCSRSHRKQTWETLSTQNPLILRNFQYWFKLWVSYKKNMCIDDLPDWVTRSKLLIWQGKNVYCWTVFDEKAKGRGAKSFSFSGTYLYIVQVPNIGSLCRACMVLNI